LFKYTVALHSARYRGGRSYQSRFRCVRALRKSTVSPHRHCGLSVANRPGKAPAFYAPSRTEMERKYMSLNQPIASPEPLSLPRFDEEATLLSARPVVPLHEVRAATRSRRLLNFASTIVAAAVVGTVGTSLLFMPGDKQTSNVAEGEHSLAANPGSDSSQQIQSDPFHDTSGTSPAGQAVQFGESATLTALTKGHTDQTTAVAPTSRKSSINREQATRTSNALRPTRTKTSPHTSAQTTLAAQNNDDDLEMDERRLRREERRDAWRLRRERINSRQQSSDDLMRIREIFEGVPRP